MSQKKQINIDQIVQQYEHLHDEGYPIDDKVVNFSAGFRILSWSISIDLCYSCNQILFYDLEIVVDCEQDW